MPSTWTANIAIEKIADGEKTDTWGQITNRNFDIIDRTTNGVGTIDLSSSGAAHTLSTTDGTAGDALTDGMYKVLVLSGATEACTVTVSPNDADKLYFVNNTSGYDVTFSQGTGDNVTISNGATGIIYCDGAGAGASVKPIIDPTTLSALGITASAAELNTLDGITSTVSELNLVDGSVAGTVTNSKAVIYGASGEVNATTLQIGGSSITSTAAELNYNDITTLGTSQPSKVVTADANGDVKFSNAVVETVYALTGTELNPNNGTAQTKTISANTTFTDGLTNGESMSLHLSGAGSYTITWPTITWITRVGNTSPILTASDTLAFFKISSTLYGIWIGSSE